MGDGERSGHIILVPIDFEAASFKALEVAKELAPCYGAEVVLLHAFAVLVQSYPGLFTEASPWPGVHVEVAAAAKRALDALAEKHGGLRSILVEGDAAKAILDEVARLRPRMVVMGTHGRARLERLF